MTKSILIVDDESASIDVLHMLFELHGFNVWTARDGLQAKLILTDRAPDLVLSDLMMPQMGGLELASYMREQEKLCAIPFILMSSMHAQLQNAPVHATLSKPIDVKVLLDTVEMLLRK